MKDKKSMVLSGMLVMVLAFGLTVLAGCSKKDKVSSTEISSEIVASENDHKIPSELIGEWYYQSDEEKADPAVLKFTPDGKCISGVQWYAISVSGNTITYDYFGTGSITGTFDYHITNGELSISGTTVEDGAFAVIQRFNPLVKK